MYSVFGEKPCYCSQIFVEVSVVYLWNFIQALYSYFAFYSVILLFNFVLFCAVNCDITAQTV